MIKDLEGTILENWWQRHLGEKAHGKRKDLSVWTVDVKTFLFHVNVRQKVTTEEDLTKRIAWHILWIKVNLFAQQPLSLPSEFMNKVATVAEIEVMRGLSNMSIHLPCLTLVPPLLNASSTSSRDQPLLHPHSSQWSTCCLVAGWLYWITSIMEGAAHSPYWNRHFSGYVFTFLPGRKILPNLPTIDLQNVSFTNQYFTQQCFWPKNTLHCHRCAPMGSCLWNSFLLPCSPPYRSSLIDRMVERPLKMRLQCLTGKGQYSPESCICSESMSYMWSCCSYSQDLWVQESRARNGNGTTCHYP